MDNIDFPMTPRITNFDLITGHVFHATFPAVADGLHSVELEIDSNHQVTETTDANNVTTALGINCLNQNASSNSQVQKPGRAPDSTATEALEARPKRNPKVPPRLR